MQNTVHLTLSQDGTTASQSEETNNGAEVQGFEANSAGLPNTQEQESSTTARPASATDKTKARRPRKRHPLNFQPNLILHNTGSVARDHLASERTFLAYVRTSLALASTGVALVQLFTIAESTHAAVGGNPTLRQIEIFARPLGATIVLFGFLVLLSAVVRYFRVQYLLADGLFPVARMNIAAITFVLGAVTAVVFGILVSTR